MTKILLLLVLAYLCLVVSSKTYKSAITCNTCVTKTGCTGNKCLFMVGDVTGEYCLGSDTCAVSSVQNVQFGQCSQDLSGQSCSSGICMIPSGDACFSLIEGQCLAGTSFSQTCANQKVDVSYTTSGVTQSTSVSLGIDCPFSTASGRFSSCSGDMFGSKCNCCASFNITGVSTMIGSCIPSDSPLLAAKASLGENIVALLSGALLFILAFLY